MIMPRAGRLPLAYYLDSGFEVTRWVTLKDCRGSNWSAGKIIRQTPTLVLNVLER